MSFGTDAWTSPNSKAYIAVTVHLEQNSVPLCMLFDLVEVAESHSGFNLAKAFHEILEDSESQRRSIHSLILHENHLLVHAGP